MYQNSQTNVKIKDEVVTNAFVDDQDSNGKYYRVGRDESSYPYIMEIDINEINDMSLCPTDDYVCEGNIGNQQYMLINNPEGGFSLQDVESQSNCKNNINYICPKQGCMKRFNHANSLTKHFKDIHNVKVYICRQCPRMFQELSELFLHARRDHVDPKKPKKDPKNFKFHCTFDSCSYMTNNGGTFEHHIRAHTGDKPFRCDICDKRFSQNANMKTHRSRHVLEKVFPCLICKKSFKTHDIYLAHLRTREHELREHVEDNISSLFKVLCLGCNECFNKLFDVRNHLKMCNQQIDYMYKCLSCNEIVTDFDSLRKHIKNHKDNMEISCPICEKHGFQGYSQLNHHITRTHAIKVNRKHVCRYCERTFETDTLMNAHVREYHADEINSRKSHGIIGRYRCPYEDCLFTANTEMLYHSHVNQHENGKLNMPVKTSPKKRGRKRKVEIVNANDSVKSELVSVNGESMDEAVKRGRGRPRKIITNTKPIIEDRISLPVIDVEEVDGSQQDYAYLAEAFFKDEAEESSTGEPAKKRRGRPRKTVEDYSFTTEKEQQSYQSTENNQSNCEFTVQKPKEMFTPYIKSEDVLENSDPDFLYV